MTDITPPTLAIRYRAMNIAIAESNQMDNRAFARTETLCCRIAGLSILLFLLSFSKAPAATTVGQWRPIFKGVDFSVSSNTPGGQFPHRQVVSAFRVDLSDPDLRLLTTQRRTNYLAGAREVGALTVSDFLR